MQLLPCFVFVLILFGVGSFLGNKSVKVEILIPASQEVIWQVLTELEHYPLWNPAFEYQEGDLHEGSKITYLVSEIEGKATTISATVNEIQPNFILNQSGGVWGVITFDHTYSLTPHGNETKVTIYEEYRGFYVNFWDTSNIYRQYKKLALALKNRVHEVS